MAHRFPTAATARRRARLMLPTLRAHGWLAGLLAGGLIAPWIVR